MRGRGVAMVKGGALAFGLLCLGGVPESHAGYLDGDALAQLCRVSSDVCLGYLEAVSDAIDTNGGLNGAKVCAPDDVTTGQLRDAFLAYLKDKPGIGRLTASRSVAAALAQAFPCK